MSVRIDKDRCNGCGKLKETLCAAVCPGDLLYKDNNGLCALREPKDCWGCAACLKECPQQAIEMFLPIQIGGRGSTIAARTVGEKMIWQLNKINGQQEKFTMQIWNKKI